MPASERVSRANGRVVREVRLRIPKKSGCMVEIAPGMWEHKHPDKNMPLSLFVGVGETDFGRRAVGTIFINPAGDRSNRVYALEFLVTKGVMPKMDLKHGMNSGSEFKLPGTNRYAHFASVGGQKKLSRREKRKLARSN